MGSVDEEEPKTRWEKIFEEGKEEEKFVKVLSLKHTLPCSRRNLMENGNHDST